MWVIREFGVCEFAARDFKAAFGDMVSKVRRSRDNEEILSDSDLRFI